MIDLTLHNVIDWLDEIGRCLDDADVDGAMTAMANIRDQVRDAVEDGAVIFVP
jgi:hypothetical protein